VSDVKVAFVHDWLTGMRGGEKALDAICAAYPGVDLFTLLHVPGSVSPTIEQRPIHTSLVQHLPLARRFYRQYLPVFPFAVEQFRFDAFDLVLSLSHCVAKSAITPERTRHLCYCFTPMRYAWDQFDAYFGPDRVGPLRRAAIRRVMNRLARWDRETASRANRYLAISQHVAQRIRRYYNREATIVYPPVDTTFYQPDQTPPGDHFLIVSALVPYKRIDLAIGAARRTGARLRVVGDGPDLPRLERLAGPEVEFLGRLTDDEIREEYRRAAAVVLPGEEDFGIVPVEAQACGRPVVALGRGGALETVIDGDTGVHVPEATPEAFAAGFDRVARMTVDSARIRRHAEQFSRDRYVRGLQTAIDEMMAAPAGTRW
jgi:glycosyltransferase involved in cell wall biosynthesis